MSDYLPPDVMVDILSRLPVKSLLRFRCVCKPWRFLISSPNFIKIHLNQAKTSKNLHKLILTTRYMSSISPKGQYSLRFDNDAFDEYAALKCPFKAKKAYFRIVGVCNGLICLSDDYFFYSYTLIIWNPAIRRFLKLPKPSVNVDSYGAHMYAIGFGFDVRKNECKVVRLAYLKQTDQKTMAMFADKPKVEVYAVSTGSWRTIEHGVPSCGVVEFLWSQAFLNGSVHWTGFKSSSKGLQNVVLSFDMAEEKFGILEFPQRYVDAKPPCFSIGLCGDSLALFRYDNPVVATLFEVYVMKEYGVVESWSELFKVEMKEGIQKVLGFRKDGEVLLVTEDNELASYEPNCRQMMNLGIGGYTGSLYAAAYDESLALLNGLNGSLGSQLKSYECLADSEDSSDGDDEVDEAYAKGRTALQFIFAAASVPGFILRPSA